MNKIKGIIIFFVIPLYAYAGGFGEIIIDWKAYLNPEGKYEVVFEPTPLNPYNWEIKGVKGFNEFELKRALIGYRTGLNENHSVEIAVRVENINGTGINAYLDRAFIKLDYPEHLNMDFSLGYIQNPWLAWTRGKLWEYEGMEIQFSEFLGILERSELGAVFGFGFKNYGAHLDFNFGIGSAEQSGEGIERYSAQLEWGVSQLDILLDGILAYSIQGEQKNSGYQELWQAGIAGQYDRVKVGGEYLQGRGWINAEEVYILGNFPKGFADYLYGVGRVFPEGREIKFQGWSLVSELRILERLKLVYRYDFFDPTARFNDDRENLNIVGLIFELGPEVLLGISYQTHDFQSYNFPDGDDQAEIEPIESITFHLQAKIP